MSETLLGIEGGTGRRILAHHRAPQQIRGRVLWAGYTPREVGGVYSGADYAPVDVAIGMGPFVYGWRLLRYLAGGVTPIYSRPWQLNPLRPGFLRRSDGVNRAARAGIFLSSQVVFLHLVRPWDGDLPPLPEVGELLDFAGFSVDVTVDDDDNRAPLVNGYHGALPSRECPWILPLEWIGGDHGLA